MYRPCMSFKRILLICSCVFLTHTAPQEPATVSINSPAQSGNPGVQDAAKTPFNDRVITAIHLIRENPNKYVTDEAIKSFVPFKEGDRFEHSKTNAFIKKLFNLGYFEHIAIHGTQLADNKLELHITLKELPEVVDIELTGNHNLSDAKIEEALKLSELRAISKRKLDELIGKLRKMYAEKDYHLTEITGEIKRDGENKATVVITINENDYSLVKRINFIGNKNVSSKALKKSIFTREDWLFGFTTKAGSYQEDRFEKDKRFLENYYKTLGYFNARVTDARIEMDPKTKQYTATFVIDEGAQYRVGELHVQGNDLLSEQELINQLPIRTGNIYSIKDVMDSIEKFKNIFGDFGYIFVDIQPSIVPNEENKTVNISFDIDLGSKVRLNHLYIKGNKKTRDYVIRRKVSFSEGDLLTYRGMEQSKERVEALSFFDQDKGVTWKINRLNDELADLDLLLKEAKTGKIMGQIGFGGNQMNTQFPSSGFSWGLNIYDINLFGKGLMFSLGTSWSKEAWTTAFDVTEPYFMDRPISIGYNFHLNKVSRSEELERIDDLSERFLGSSLHVGYISSRWTIETALRGIVGFENISLNQPPRLSPNVRDLPGANAYQRLIHEEFKNGSLYHTTFELGQDCRNHILHPSGGYQWSVTSRFGWPLDVFGFMKFDFDYSWYTSLIDEYGLSLGFHAHGGYMRPIGHYQIPFNELYNIGGPASVRGFEWGEISPSFSLSPYCGDEDNNEGRCGEPIGGRKAFFVNVELNFPIKRDYTIKGALFYDGGSGWCPPKLNLTPSEQARFLSNTAFDYRQSIGIGIRMLQPQNLKIDWSFKLDRRPCESPSAVHFGMFKEF